MTPNIKDSDLLKRIKQGEEPAFRMLFDKYYKQVCYAAYTTYADEHKAKDFAQEVFLSLWKRRNELKIQVSIAAFLKRAAIYKAIDYIRAQRLDFEKENVLHRKETNSGEQTEYKELKELIHRTVENLPERCRIIFFMSRFEKLSHKEIATRLAISEKTIENQITKALKILRKVVANYSEATKISLIIIAHWIRDFTF